MQSSSKALAACAVALVAAYFPIFLTPDALAQTILPTPTLTPVAFGPSIQPPVATSSPAIAATATTAVVKTPKTVASPSGEQLVIPSINLDDPIVPVGVDPTGAMAVPNGKTNQVGWYDGGPQPGQPGSAVLDAHVFAAFSKLDQVQVGDDIYVKENGQTLTFVVTKVQLFATSEITSQDLFVPTTDRDLNLITCAGKLTPDHSTYDHRLVIYTTLVN
jgi:LPXTG-site transpeptidase (sortase) family protein